MIKQEFDNLRPKKTSFNGIYRGVIEDNVDPEKLGRCKVRVWGIHDEDKTEDELEGIPTDKLPWAEPCLGLVEGSVTGAGAWSVPLQGSHVFLFFEGGNWDSPRYFATAPAQPTEAPDTSKGFNDPNGEYPRSDRLGEPDYHRLARGVTGDTIVPHKNDNKDEEVKIGLSQIPHQTWDTWDEPDSAYAAEYPKNIVLATHKGITIELDNTDGAERIHIWHPSNSYIEIDVDGNLIFRNENDRYEITRGDSYRHVLKDETETIDVDKTTLIGADHNVEIGGSVNRDVATSVTEKIGADWTIDVTGNVRLTVGGGIDVTATEDINITSIKNVNIKGENVNLN